MTEEAIAAEAAAEPVSAPETTSAEPKADAKAESTARGAIDRAFAKAFDETAAEPEKGADKPDAKTEAKAEKTTPAEGGGQERDEHGRFKAKDGTTDEKSEKPESVEAKPDEKPATDVPSRFSADAKAAWKDTPAPVQAEIRRAMSEMETGLNQYQQRFESLKPYEALAQQYGTSIEKALDNYIGLERQLHQNPMDGLQRVFDYIGVSPRDFAAHVMGQSPDQAASQQDAIIRGLRQEIAGLKNDLQGVSTTLKTDKESAVARQVSDFAAQNPRFEELADDIAVILQVGKASNLQDAYALADRLNPAPAPAPAPAVPETPAAPKPDLAAQTRKSGLSVTGAPSPGSNPANRKPPSSARAAIDDAFARAGL